jgi:hypothetical protein
LAPSPAQEGVLDREEPIRQEGLDTPDVTTAEDVGHANTSMTTDVYFGRKVAVTGAAAVFQALDT